MRTDQRTRAYVARGLSKREVMRCLKRYAAREIYLVLTTSTKNLTNMRGVSEYASVSEYVRIDALKRFYLHSDRHSQASGAGPETALTRIEAEKNLDCIAPLSDF